MVFALNIWRHYLYGGKFDIFTNYKSLKYQRRWIKCLKDYDFTLQYHLSKVNIVTDALSQKPRGFIALQNLKSNCKCQVTEHTSAIWLLNQLSLVRSFKPKLKTKVCEYDSQRWQHKIQSIGVSEETKDSGFVEGSYQMPLI